MKTLRTPDALAAEYCPLPLTHPARPYVHSDKQHDVRKTWAAYGWAETPHGQSPYDEGYPRNDRDA
jgi:hypothetical protein